MMRRRIPIQSLAFRLLLPALLSLMSCDFFTSLPNRKIAYIKLNDIWMAAENGDAAEQLTSSADEGLPTWSPDGLRLAYVHSPGSSFREIRVIKSDGTGQLNLTNAINDSSYPTWSPDNKTLYFIRDPNSSGATIRSVDVRTGIENPNPIAGPFAEPNCDSASYSICSPDGSKIMALVWNNAVGNKVYVKDLANGSEYALVSDIVIDNNNYPTWSPDSSRISFFSGSNLYIANSDRTSTAVDCQTFTGQSSAESPDWSYDGQMIAYSSSTGATSQISVIILRNGSTYTVPYTFSNTNTIYLKWMPDNKRICFIAGYDTGPGDPPRLGLIDINDGTVAILDSSADILINISPSISSH